jgi:hypothetical protein
VFLCSNRSAALAALATALALCGCANSDYDTTAAWFSKPLDLFGSKGGYTYANLGDLKQERSITASDLVDANGVCPVPAAPAPTPTLMQPGPDIAGASSADVASLFGGGVAIGMSECEVVARLGQPAALNLGRNPIGERTAAFTFNGGPRPGVYRFAGGRLVEMDRVEAPPPPPPAEPAKKKMVKKKPEKPKLPPKPDAKT